MESNIFWHTQTTEQAFAELKSQPSGLSQTEVTERTLQYGVNEIQAAKRVSPAHKLRVVTALQANGHIWQ